MDREDIDPVGTQPPKAILRSLDNVAQGEAAVRYGIPAAKANFGGDDGLGAPRTECLTKIFLGLAARIG